MEKLKRVLCLFLSVVMISSTFSMPASAGKRETATPKINNAFNKDFDKAIGGYAEGYGWDLDKNGENEWTSDITDEDMHWTEGNQIQFYYDNDSTTSQHLWDIDFGGGFWGDSYGTLGLESGLGSSIVQVAYSQLGEPESPPNSNHCKFVTWFYGDSSAAAPWCCIFVLWCAYQCGYVDNGLFKRTASSSEMFRYMTQQKGYNYCSVQDVWNKRETNVQPGDIIFFKKTDDPSPAKMKHIGIVVEYNEEENYILTIEGNTSANCVTTKKYTPSTKYPAMQRGYIVRPPYPEEGTN